MENENMAAVPISPGDSQDAEEQAARRCPLKGSKKAFAWLLGLFFFTLGVAIVVGYEIYWARVVVPERKILATAISVASDKLDPRNDGKLIYVVGELAGAKNLADPEFGVASDALRLRRRVWMYQWEQGGVQSKSSYGVEDSHGNTTTLLKTRTYDYSKDWSEKTIDSRSFYNAGHDNPARKEIPDRAIAAAKITLGVFTIAPELVEQIDNFQTVPVSDKNLSVITEPLRTKAKLAGDEIYFGTNAGQPAIGDLKVKFESAPPATASVIARQNGNNLSPYQVTNAGSVALLRVGTYSVPDMVAQFAKTNSQGRVLAWVAGCVLILFGSFVIKIARRR
jgi:Transmembrane protein 43